MHRYARTRLLPVTGFPSASALGRGVHGSRLTVWRGQSPCQARGIRPCPRQMSTSAARAPVHKHTAGAARVLDIRGRPTTRSPVNNRAPTRRYLESESGCLRCKRRGCFVCFSRVADALPAQCFRRRPDADLLVAAAFRTKRLLRERCAVTCQRRRRPGQAGRRQGRLQITADWALHLSGAVRGR